MAPRPIRLLILGGTKEARLLAARLADDIRFSIITSLAGRTETPAAIAGSTRRGGFGGIDGIRSFLEDEAIDIVVDATHPYAATISANAITAAQTAGRIFYRLCRPCWSPVPGDNWIAADDVDHAASLLVAGAAAFLTIGHQQLAPFTERRDVTILARMIEAPVQVQPDHITILRARPPFTIDHEMDLMRRHAIDVLVTKNAGGEAVRAKLDAARNLAIPVIMIKRPSGQPAIDAATVPDMLALLEHHAT